MAVTLSPEELELVRSILADHLSSLRMEIVDTEDYDLRQTLKRNEAMIKDLLGRTEKEIQHMTRGMA